MTAGVSLDRARAVFEWQAWGDAYTQLSAADRQAALAPEDLERLAIAAHLVGHDAESAEAWTRAHHAFQRQRATPGAARCAFWLGFTCLIQGARQRQPRARLARPRSAAAGRWRARLRGARIPAGAPGAAAHVGGREHDPPRHVRSGGSARRALRRRFRGVHELSQHFLVKLDTFTTAGAVLAGAEADLTVF